MVEVVMFLPLKKQNSGMAFWEKVLYWPKAEILIYRNGKW